LNQAHECATGTAQKTVSLSGLRCFFVPKISREEQEAIVGELDFLSEKICYLETIYRQKLTALKELKQSILQKAFTGELTTEIKKTAEEEIAA
jgi:type I restriction enzyme S subunit